MPALFSASSISGQTSRWARTYSSTRSGFTRRTNPNRWVISVCLLQDHDDECPRSVDALDSFQFDVRGGRRARHERERSTLATAKRGERLRHSLHDLIRSNDADVDVRDERERAPAFHFSAGEDERAGLGDRDRAPRDDAVESIKLVRAQAVVFYRVGRSPPLGETTRDGDTAAARKLAEQILQSRCRRRLDPRAIVEKALAQERDAARIVEDARRAICTCDGVGWCAFADRGPRPRQNLVTRLVHGSTTPGRSPSQTASDRESASTRRAGPAHDGPVARRRAQASAPIRKAARFRRYERASA